MQNIIDKNKEINLKKRRATTRNSRINGHVGDCTEIMHKQYSVWTWAHFKIRRTNHKKKTR